MMLSSLVTLDVVGDVQAENIRVKDAILVGDSGSDGGRYGEVLTSQGKNKPMIWKAAPSTLLTESGIRLVHPAQGRLVTIPIEDPRVFWKNGKTVRIKTAGLGEPGSHIEWKFGVSGKVCEEYWSANHTPFYGFPQNSTASNMAIYSTGLNPMWSAELVLIYQNGTIKGVMQYNTTQDKDRGEDARSTFGQYVFELQYLPGSQQEQLELYYTTASADTTIWYTLVEALN